MAVLFKVQLRFDVEGQELVAISPLLEVIYCLVIIFIEAEVVLLCIANNAISRSHCIKVILIIEVYSSYDPTVWRHEPTGGTDILRYSYL